MEHRHYGQNDLDWSDLPQQPSPRRSKKEEKRKRKFWDEDDLNDDIDSWENDELDQY